MEVHRQPRSIQPLLPQSWGGRLCESVAQILRDSGRLTGQVHSPLVLSQVGELVRATNCCSSSLIEDHKTTTREIERATQGDFSRNEVQRNNQQLGLREQRRTVTELEKQFTRLELGLAALRRVQTNLQHGTGFRQSILPKALTRGLVS